MSGPRCCLALVAGLLLAHAARADDLHFMIVFGSEEISLRVQHAHSFATFVKASGTGPDLDQYQLQWFTLSWVPAKGDARLLTFRSERGSNLELRETLDWAAYEEGAHISMWGPYQIDAELYERAACAFTALESGQVGYKVEVHERRRDRATNCIHVISDLGHNPAAKHLGNRSYGEPASYFATLALLPHILDPDQKHDWLVERLGLTEYPISPRGLEESPTPGGIRRCVQNVLHARLRRSVGK